MVDYYSQSQNEEPVEEEISTQWDPTLSYDEQSLNMMESVFNKRYKYEDKSALAIAGNMLNTAESVTISGKLVALEIIKSNQSAISYPKLLINALIVVCIPIVRAFIRSEPIFKNEY